MIAAGSSAIPTSSRSSVGERGEVHRATQPRPERIAGLDASTADATRSAEAGDRGGDEVDGARLRVQGRNEHLRGEVTDRRRERAGEPHRRLPPRVVQSVGDELEVRPRRTGRGRHRDARGDEPVATRHRGRDAWLGGGREPQLVAREAEALVIQTEPDAAPATSKSFRLPPSASAAARAPGTEMTSKRVVMEWSTSNGDNEPPVITTCREPEVARSSTPWRPRTSLTVSGSRAAFTATCNGRSAFVRSMVTAIVRPLDGRSASRSVDLRAGRSRRRRGTDRRGGARPVRRSRRGGRAGTARRGRPRDPRSAWRPTVPGRGRRESDSSKPTRSSSWRSVPGRATAAVRK